MTYTTLSDDQLDTEKHALMGTRDDLLRSLAVVESELDGIKREEHRRFCEQVKKFTNAAS